MQEFMHRMTSTHVRRWQKRWSPPGSGPVYQGRYHSKLVKTDLYYYSLIKYIEQNPLRARLVDKAEEWKWSSAFFRKSNKEKFCDLLDAGPLSLPKNWNKTLNKLPNKRQEEVNMYLSKFTRGSVK